MSREAPRLRVVPPDFPARARKPRSCLPYFAAGVGCLVVLVFRMGGVGLLTIFELWSDVMPSGPGFAANDRR